MNCPCQSGKAMDACCGRFISHRALPENAQQLMRSRYTAFVLGDADYLRDTWHADFRPPQLNLDKDQRWLDLSVLDFSEQGDSAIVEFEACFLHAGTVQGLHERSRFVLQQGRWLYTDGDCLPLGFSPWKPGRNESCPCGSGQKFKRCCAR